MELIEFPFSKDNTAYAADLVPLVRRAASQGLSDPWLVAPVEDLLHHANINAQDARYKLTLMALRDSGVKYLIVPPEDANLENMFGEGIPVTECVTAEHEEVFKDPEPVQPPVAFMPAILRTNQIQPEIMLASPNQILPPDFYFSETDLDGESAIVIIRKSFWEQHKCLSGEYDDALEQLIPDFVETMENIFNYEKGTTAQGIAILKAAGFIENPNVK